MEVREGELLLPGAPEKKADYSAQYDKMAINRNKAGPRRSHVKGGVLDWSGNPALLWRNSETKTSLAFANEDEPPMSETETYARNVPLRDVSSSERSDYL
jgi:hypothetical protein